tara:strand:+ start:354 stop:1322 length:969 start_codon:yes stop_codon:yes gene_type:complete
MLNIGINGFGRMGKLAARVILNDPKLNLVSINHPTINRQDFIDILQYDSVHGEFTIPKTTVNIHNHYEPKNINWEDNIDLILETTGKFKELNQITPHLEYTQLEKSTKIIVSAPSKTLPMYVYGVNHLNYTNEQFMSGASCTTTCLAPIANILHSNYKIKNGLATTIHSATSSQYAVDKYTSGKRTGRSLLNNIIPSTTGAAVAIGKIIPELDGKLNAIGIRVPVQDVSLLDLTVYMESSPDITSVMNLFKQEAVNNYRDTLMVTDKLLVSSDFVGSPYNAIIDEQACMKQGDLYKILAWYDNEMGYVQNILRLTKYINSVK